MTIDPITHGIVLHPWAEATARLAGFDADALRRELHGWVRDPAVRTVGALRARLDDRLGPHVGDLALAAVCAAFGVSYARDDRGLPRAEAPRRRPATTARGAGSSRRARGRRARAPRRRAYGVSAPS